MIRRRKHLINATLIISICFAIATVFADDKSGAHRSPPPTPAEPFSPSNARTADGGFIPVEQFFPSTRCASCHKDTHAFWSQSLHRNAAREPFYRESADILLRTRGIEFTRHCESCHTPVALFAGVLTKTSPRQQAPFTKLDDEGVTCSVCHSITEARLDGTGSFTIRRPALLAREDGSPIFGDFTDEEILADVPAHKRAVMRPLLRQPEFCATCHKVAAPPELNGYKNLKGFSAYDEWQQSGASHESVLPFYMRDQRTDCRSCHMPKIESLNDRAAKNGLIASHRWLGANTAAPLFYGQTSQVTLIQDFLKANVLNVDIFALKSESSGECAAPLDSDNAVMLMPGEEVTAEVVVANRNAAHSFPPEVRDLYEAWVEFEAVDAAGRSIFHSGFVKPDGMLDESAHVYKTIILDEAGRAITRHQIWTTNIKAYDNTILPGRSDVVRFRFRLPEGSAAESVTLRARVNYRRFNQEFTNYVLAMQRRELTVPVVRMAEAEATLRGRLPFDSSASGSRAARAKARSSTRAPQFLPASHQAALSLRRPLINQGQSPSAIHTAIDPAVSKATARRWNDYGIGLLEQAEYGAASEAFRRSAQLDPKDPNLLINAAIAEFKTERFGPEHEQLRKAATLLDDALKLDPDYARTRYWRALVSRAEGNRLKAAEELAKIAQERPRDREVLRQLGQTLYALGRTAEACAAFEAVTAIEPQDAGAYQFLAAIYASEGRSVLAERARGLYLQWRDDPIADPIAARFFAAHPQWADERIASHKHGTESPARPTLTGSAAVPDR